MSIAIVEKNYGPTPPATYDEFLAACARPTPPEIVRSREGWKDRQGNTHMVRYVEWDMVADILDFLWPVWSHKVENIAHIGDMVAITASVTINGITRQGVGTGTAESEMGIKKAEHDALKRAAVKFGIARDLYQEDTPGEVRQGQPSGGGQQRSSGQQGQGGYQTKHVSEISEPLARPGQRTCSQAQFAKIQQEAANKGLDVQEQLIICWPQMQGHDVEELASFAASSFIDYLIKDAAAF